MQSSFEAVASFSGAFMSSGGQPDLAIGSPHCFPVCIRRPDSYSHSSAICIHISWPVDTMHANPPKSLQRIPDNFQYKPYNTCRLSQAKRIQPDLKIGKQLRYPVPAHPKTACANLI
jgi:hypothetical protein